MTERRVSHPRGLAGGGPGLALAATFCMSRDRRSTRRDADHLNGVTKLGRGESWVVQFVLDGRRFEAELVDEYGLVRVGRLGWSANGSDSD